MVSPPKRHNPNMTQATPVGSMPASVMSQMKPVSNAAAAGEGNP